MKFIVFLINFIFPKNWPLLFYYLLNIGLMYLIEYIIFKEFVGLFPSIYIISMLIAFSPFGETILRLRNKVDPVETLGDSRIIRLFNEVYDEAKKQSKIRLSRNVKLYYKVGNDINACAVGVKTIIIHTGILNLSDRQIKAILFHEFSHLIEQDSLYNITFMTGNVVLYSFLFIIKWTIFCILYVILFIFDLIIETCFNRNTNYEIIMKLFGEILNIINILWKRLGLVLCMLTMRSSEYKADKFAKKNGYGAVLADILDRTRCDIDADVDTVFLTHPTIDKRIQKLLAN